MNTLLDGIQARLASRKGMISLRQLQSPTGRQVEGLFESLLAEAFDEK